MLWDKYNAAFYTGAIMNDGIDHLPFVWRSERLDNIHHMQMKLDIPRSIPT